MAAWATRMRRSAESKKARRKEESARISPDWKVTQPWPHGGKTCDTWQWEEVSDTWQWEEVRQGGG